MLSQHSPASTASIAGYVQGRFPDDERDLVQARAAQGWGCGRIAQALNRHPASTRYVMLVLGCYRSKPVRPSMQGHAGRPKPFSADEDLFVTACRVAGHPLSVIARAATNRFGHRRTTGAIRMRLLLLAAKEEARNE